MELADKIKLVKAWGFTPFLSNEHTFSRKAPQGFTEWWAIDRENYIDFVDNNGNFSHTYRIDWSIFKA